MRRSIASITGAVAIGALAAGFGGTLAGSASAQWHARSSGSIVGAVAFAGRHFGVVVHVFDVGGASVASEYVSPRDDRFRFNLPPGQYDVELTKPSAVVDCQYEKAVSVRAGRTTRVDFVAAVLTPGCGTY
jgi:hypothetical protein